MAKRLGRIICLLVLLVTLVVPTAYVGVAAKDAQISIWSLNQNDPSDPVGVWLDKKAKEFNAANPGITVTYVYAENQSYQTKVQVAMFGNAGPDIFYNWGGESQAVYSREGMLYDLTRALGSNKWGLAKGLFATHTQNKRIYGIPLFPMVGEIWYNQDMFKKNGWTVPKTWGDFLALCGKIKAKGIIPLAMGGKDSWTILQPFMYLADRLAGAQLYANAKAGKARFDAAEFVKAFQLMQDLAKKGYLNPDVLSLGYAEAGALMTTDKAAMMSMGNWHYGTLTNGFTQELDKWSFFAFPGVEGGKGNPKAVIGAADGFSVNKACKNPNEAVKFLKFLYSRDSLVELYKSSSRLVSLGTPYMPATERPQIKGIADLLAGASSLTQWWDQDLPAAMTQTLLTSLQEIVGGVTTPQAAATALEKARGQK